jgi:U2 small nuclear ribonucleoprotein A'
MSITICRFNNKQERQEAKKLFDGKAGPAALAESIAATKSSTFEPGEGIPGEQQIKSSVPTLQMSKEDQDKIKAALAKATTLDEISRLERALKEGKIPSDLKDQNQGRSIKKQKLDGGEQEEEEEEEDTPMA